MPTRYVSIAAHELDESLTSAWDRLQLENPLFKSPYLSPWFTKAVSQFRDDVFVTVLENDGRPVGFFPFQRQGSRGSPVAGTLNDCQAVVVDPLVEWSPRDLLVGSGLRLWDFDHLLAEQVAFQPFMRLIEQSPTIELAEGFDAYLLARKKAGSSRIAQMQRKWRKLMREQGDTEAVRFDLLSNDRRALSQVIEWKIEQCERTGTYPFFREKWAVDLVEFLLEQDRPGCSGALSVLWVQDQIAAAHFGLTSVDVWHWWFPTYSEEWSTYSPGALLLLRLCEYVSHPSSAQNVIDLGRGHDAYKTSFSNSSYSLFEGYVSKGSTYALARSLKRASVGWARDARFLEPVRRARRTWKKET